MIIQICLSCSVLNVVNMKGDDDQTKKSYNGRAAASTGLNNSDFDKQLTALHNVKQMEDADMRDIALVSDSGYVLYIALHPRLNGLLA